jgi:hypothetical protein
MYVQYNIIIVLYYYNLLNIDYNSHMMYAHLHIIINNIAYYISKKRTSSLSMFLNKENP